MSKVASGWLMMVFAVALAACEPAGREAALPAGRTVVARDDARASATPSGTTGAIETSPPVAALAAASDQARARYPWLRQGALVRALEDAFPAPRGFSRAELAPDSFGAWLRRLPLRAPGTPVLTHTGSVLRQGDDPRIAAVAELDIGAHDLQQCADSVIRLHAEWLWSQRRTADIRYHATSGDLVVWPRYANGDRPQLVDKKLSFSPGARPDASHDAFRRYLDVVFTYAGTVSVAHYAARRPREKVRPGDFFVLPGGPGHAVLVLDMATDDAGRKLALLGQGFMPAQDFQVLSGAESGWYSLDAEAIDTPFWSPFPWSSLRRLPD